MGVMVDDPTHPNPADLPTIPGPDPKEAPAVTPTLRASDTDLRPHLGKPVVELPEPGYKLGNLIGRGGMGEVMAARDDRIGRDVAIKRMRNPNPNKEAIARFLREARIQARLDHPSIVPVHELGVDESGRPYFTMKRCAGITLARELADGASFHKLLRVFISVCRAMDYAHERGVVHRDLKPANIIVGKYDEVYILDWGVARVIGEPSDDPGASLQPHSETPDPEDSTKSGALLGTPGYIAPEQIEGDPPAPPVDIYALGCILFEILACEPLHPRGEPAIGRTLSTPQDSPARRRPDRGIPPELDQACFAALANNPAERPTAHELGDRIQAYLDGDRDLARRRSLAAIQVTTARKALDDGGPTGRVTALQSAARAIALDPEALGAAELVSSILLEPPKEIPRELELSLDEHEARINRDRSKKAMYAYGGLFAVIPIVLLLEVKDWIPLIAFYGIVGLGVATAWRAFKVGRPSVPVAAVIAMGLAILFTRVAGPFILTPLAICAAIVALTAIDWFNERAWAVVAWVSTAVMLPIFLEWFGVIPGTWSIRGEQMMIQSDIFRTHGFRDEVALVVTNLIFTLIVAVYTLGINRRRRQSQRALFIHAWHLRQLVPSSRAWATQPR